MKNTQQNDKVVMRKISKEIVSLEKTIAKLRNKQIIILQKFINNENKIKKQLSKSVTKFVIENKINDDLSNYKTIVDFLSKLDCKQYSSLKTKLCFGDYYDEFFNIMCSNISNELFEYFGENLKKVKIKDERWSELIHKLIIKNNYDLLSLFDPIDYIIHDKNANIKLLIKNKNVSESVKLHCSVL